MKEGKSGWRTVGLVALVLALIMTLVAAGTPLAEGTAGLVGLVALVVCLTALTLVVAAVWPRFVERTRQTLERSAGKAFLVGLVNYVFLGALGLVFLNLGPIAVVGLLLGGLLLLGTFLGLPAVAALVGARLYSLREQEANRWAELVVGGVALDLAMLVPAAGWFILLPAVCLWSLGAATLTLLSRRSAPVDEA
jgi:hypothetical protein